MTLTQPAVSPLQAQAPQGRRHNNSYDRVRSDNSGTDMIKGIGVDLVTVSRIKGVYERHGDRFARRFLATTEIELLQTYIDQPERLTSFLAKRFAAKEAAVKALGTGEREGVLLKDFSISHDDLGKPLLHVAGQAKILADKMGVTHLHVTLSDEKDQVIAMVLLEG